MTLSPTRLLLVLITLLATGLTSLWLDPQGQWRNLVWSPPAALSPDVKPPPALVAVVSGSTAHSYASVLERPLFAPDRRPPPPPAPPAPPPPPDPLAGLQIYGVLSGEAPGILARVEGKMRRIMVKQTVGPWTLSQTDGRTATFSNGDEKREFKMAYAQLGPRTPPPTAARAPGANPNPNVNANTIQSQQDQIRETLRRRNEIRAARGLPMITQ